VIDSSLTCTVSERSLALPQATSKASKTESEAERMSEH
jgi:hypothetical protein